MSELETALKQRDADWRQAFRSILFGGPLPNNVDYADLAAEVQRARDKYWQNAYDASEAKSADFVREMICRCASSITVANAALKIDWAQMNYDGPQPLRQFIKALEDYAAKAKV